jgi:hypothetical protein
MTRAAFLIAMPLLGACASSSGPPPPRPGVAAGEGRSCDTAVPIDADRESAGAAIEGEWIAKHFPGSRVGNRNIIQCRGRQTEMVVVETARGDVRLFFDISKYYGKF